MYFKYLFILVFTALLATSCANENDSVTLVKSFLEARNSYDAETLRELTVESYQELFKNDLIEIKSQEEFLTHLEWAKELSSKTTIKEVISSNAANVVVIEESKNYIDEALKRQPRNFQTTYYLKDGKIVKQSFDNAPDEKFDIRANDVLYGNFERFCKVHKIPLSWEPTKEDGAILRKALEKYANREE
ncbi:MAG: hypothetical protein AAF617_03685 [Bacteroidota bacterium]